MAVEVEFGVQTHRKTEQNPVKIVYQKIVIRFTGIAVLIGDNLVRRSDPEFRHYPKSHVHFEISRVNKISPRLHRETEKIEFILRISRHLTDRIRRIQPLNGKITVGKQNIQVKLKPVFIIPTARNTKGIIGQNLMLNHSLGIHRIGINVVARLHSRRVIIKNTIVVLTADFFRQSQNDNKCCNQYGISNQ